MRLHLRTVRTLLLATLVAGVALAGCSHDETVAPAPADAPEFGVPVDTGSSSSGLLGSIGGLLKSTLSDVASFVAGDLLPDVFQTQVIGPAGGTVSGGYYTIHVPAGAVTEPTTFELRYFADGPTVFELLPHGVEFQVPVTIAVDLTGTSLERASDVTLYWYDEDAEDWVDVGGVWSRRNNLLVGTTTHFSKWGSGRAGW